MNPWIATLFVLVLLAASMAVLSIRECRTGLSTEAVRKFLHVEMGLVALAFPWLFAEAWPVLVLALAAVAWFGMLYASSWLDARFGRALHGAGRDSRGAVWFTCGVCLTYLTSAAEPVYYCIAILVLALADTAAALIGRRFGSSCRMPGGAHKSPAGSFAFFVVAFTVVLVGLHVAADIGFVEALGTAFLVAAVTTTLEAILGDGLDNLCIPAGVLAALDAELTAFPASFALAFTAVTALALVFLSRSPDYQ
jgi:phytol kinase